MTQREEILNLQPVTLSVIIQNAAYNLRSTKRFNGAPLWYLASEIFGVGSGTAHDICNHAGFMAEQYIGKSPLKPSTPYHDSL